MQGEAELNSTIPKFLLSKILLVNYDYYTHRRAIDGCF